MENEAIKSDPAQAIEKPARTFDVYRILVVFFIGISVGALVPVGMKFFGHWNQAPVATESPIEEAKVAKAVHTGRLKKLAPEVVVKGTELPAMPESEPGVDHASVKKPVPEAVKTSPKKAAAKKAVIEKDKAQKMALKSPSAKQETEVKVKDLKPKIDKEAASVPASPTTPAPAPASLSSNKDKKAEKGPILEELANGPSAMEIQDLTAVYTGQKLVTVSKNVIAVKTAAPSQMPAADAPSSMAPTPEAAPQAQAVLARQSAPLAKRGDFQNVAMQAKAMPAMAGKTATPGILSALNRPAQQDEAAEAKVVAVVINNASYSKNSLNACSKRCLLMGMDAFGMPIKAIINGAAYAQALLNHRGTINISGQPRLVKNQQIVFVESITFNLGSKASQSDSNQQNKNAIPSDPDDPKPGSVVKTQ